MNQGLADQPTRDRILAAASSLFAERGVDGVSIRDITSRAGVNLGAVTYHFGGKDELVAAVIQRRIVPLLEIRREVEEADLGVREKLSLFFLKSSMHILHHDPTMRAFFAECLHGGKRLPAIAAGVLKERNRFIGRLIQQGVKEGLFKSCDVESTTWIFCGMLMPFVLHEHWVSAKRPDEPYSKAYVERVVKNALDIFFQGLEKR